MSSRFFKKNSVLHQAITKLLPANIKGKKRDMLEVFLGELYALEPLDELKKISPETLCMIACHLFTFVQERKKGTPKIRIVNPEQDQEGWEGEYTVIEMVNADRPFLVDSITEALNQQKLVIYNMFHPVIHLQRDKNGKLQKLTTAGEDRQNMQAESVIHIHISPLDKKRHKALQATLEQVICSVRVAVDDWQQNLQKLDEVTHEFALAAAQRTGNLPADRAEKFAQQVAETQAFLAWLKADNFVFLGYAYYQIDSTQNPLKVTSNDSSYLGVLTVSDPEDIELVGNNTCQQAIEDIAMVEITKSNQRSEVHRAVHMDYISMRAFDANGVIVGEHRFVGLFTSQVYYQSAQLIPIIRRKIDYIRQQSGYISGGHNAKALVAVLESFPRDELFQISEGDLYSIAMDTVMLATRQRVRLFVRKDDFGRFLSCIIYIPRERMSTSLRLQIGEILAQELNGSVSSNYAQITEAHLARIQFIIKTDAKNPPVYNVKSIEQKLAEAVRLWSDILRNELLQRHGRKEGELLIQRYQSRFPAAYTERFSPEDAYYDILQLELLDASQSPIRFDIYQNTHDEKAHFHLKIYHRCGQVSLSHIMPILENMGLSILDEHSYLLEGQESKPVWLYHFRFKIGIEQLPKLKEFKVNLEEALWEAWEGHIENDGFNRLIIGAGMTWRDVMTFRAYSRYLKQIQFSYSQEFIQRTLSNHPTLVALLNRLFVNRFDYRGPKKQTRQEEEARLIKIIDRGLANVADLSEDTVIRTFAQLVQATVRTNYYQNDQNGDHKNYVAFKFLSNQVPGIPLPRPFAEIFVYSPRVEAIHLRGGKVARGGLRWSDRQEDFRTEILGLMKAQMTKNAVIVPVGSKGGFVVKRPPKEGGRDAWMQEGIACYQTFLRGLLDLTDNYDKDKVIPPKQVVRHDGDDPYLVVAADKGTATFSDFANSVSGEYNFWLGDAFASGGSAGYDHKKMGITARGAWVSVQRHFRELELDIQREDFTVIGVGDMAGDVFGNGMLLSEHICLVGAFNHQHIFLDPAPNAGASYKERQRLFALPKSSWEDYNKSLISKGGGIFDRHAKQLSLSKEVMALLDITASKLTPDELIQAMLKAPIDLLWNGGIGTYVKATHESHTAVGDRANDNVRVNATDLRARVVGEGGNLGLTQLGRIEYARHGGRINTDAIDNSAGVDCSDHEVNIKIALNIALGKKGFTFEKRNHLLTKMTDTVADLVLRDNRLQTQALSIAEYSGPALLELQAQLMKRLEKEGRLNRSIENLPLDEEVQRLYNEGKGLTRPELSVLLGYSKLALYDELLHSELPDDPYYAVDLGLYFPEEMRTKFQGNIDTHPLRRDIIATYVTNSIVNRVGSTFFHQMKEDTGRQACDIARAYTIVRDLFGLRTLWHAIEKLDGKIAADVQIDMFLEIQNFIERGCAWMLHHRQERIRVGDIVDEFRQGIDELKGALPSLIAQSPYAESLYEGRLKKYRAKKVPESLAKQVAILEAMGSAFNIVEVAKNHASITVAGEVYFAVGARLSLGWMRTALGDIAHGSYLQRLSYKMLINALFDQQMRISSTILKSHKRKQQDVLPAWEKECANLLERYDRFVTELKRKEVRDIHVFVIAAKRIEELHGPNV